MQIRALKMYVRAFVNEALASNVDKRKLVNDLFDEILSVLASEKSQSTFRVTGHYDDVDSRLWDISSATEKFGLPSLHLVLASKDPMGGPDGMLVPGSETKSGISLLLLNVPFFEDDEEDENYSGLKKRMKRDMQKMSYDQPRFPGDVEKIIDSHVLDVMNAMKSIVRHELIHFLDQNKLGMEKFKTSYRSAHKGTKQYFSHGHELEAYVQQAIMDAKNVIEKSSDKVRTKGNVLGSRPEDFVNWVTWWINQEFVQNLNIKNLKKFYRSLAIAREQLLEL